ncbi:MAG: 4-(cytidine 5'-diphospho)-2-C-methyl-D-erythritol kinase [Chitinophagales bacterium]
MISFPNGKINIGLHVIRKRADGYHDLETIFYPIAVRDVLEISPAGRLQLHLSGIRIEGEQRDNLCIRAYQLLKSDFPDLPPIDIHLHKNIPMGAGLGGGSADGAFLLQLLNMRYDLQLSKSALIEYASRLGSDCPFFILNQPCFAKARGEILEAISIDLEGYAFVLLHPGIKISTEAAFSMISPSGKESRLKSLIGKPIHSWKNEIVNEFEEPVIKAYPALRGIKTRLYEAGAVYASMTGSGSSFYGIFEKQDLPKKDFFDNYPVPINSDFFSSSMIFQ